MNVLSSLDLEQLVKQYKINNFNGIFSKDLLPDILREGWYIINLQDHDKGNGTHWAIFKITNDKVNIYFDSFNFVAPHSVSEKIKPYIYNDKQIQDVDSSACGWYCIACMDYVEKHNVFGDILAFKEFINKFSKNTDFNDGILYKCLK
jgi:hypothetical protein